MTTRRRRTFSIRISEIKKLLKRFELVKGSLERIKTSPGRQKVFLAKLWCGDHGFTFEEGNKYMSEIDKYRHGEPYHDQYCLELFRRALAECDPLAWEVVQQTFYETMLGWMRSHPLRGGRMSL
jgi:hypothetical protein